MYEFQDEGEDFLKQWGRAMLADEPGLGKSKQALRAANGRTLVVAPAAILDSGVWIDERERWRPDLDLTEVSYTQMNQWEPSGKKFGRVPTDRLRDDLRRQRFDTIIFDECHYVKGRDTCWTLASQQAVKLQAPDAQTFLLSGTPIPNWAYELFTSLTLMFPDDARRGGPLGSYWRWAREWFNVGPTRFSQMAVGEPLEDTPEYWARFHAENFRGRFLQRLRDDVLPDLPPLTEQELRLPMTEAQGRAYRQLKKDFITWLESGTEIVAWNNAALTVKLAKVCTGLEVVDDTAKGWKQSNKLRLFRDRVADQAQPSLAVAHFKRSVELAAEAARDVGARVAVYHGDTPKGQRRQIVRDFQAGRYDVLCASIGVIKEGLTLTRADTCHMLEHSWRPSSNEQVIRRIHRIGQTRPVTVLHYRSDKSIDYRIKSLTESKTDQQMKALRPADLAALV